MSIWPYRKRDYESMSVWHARVIGCPLLQGESMELVAELSGARLEDLWLSKRASDIVRREFERDVAAAKKEDADDDRF